MPSQLQRRLQRFLDASVARTINALAKEPLTDNPPVTDAQILDISTQPPTNRHAHWLGGSFGKAMQDIQSVTLHGTSGWPSYASADHFRVVYDCTSEYGKAKKKDGTPYWYSKRGIGPQYFVDPNGTIFPLIGPEDLEGDPLFTWHSEGMSKLSLGIEQADGGDERAIDSTSRVFCRLDANAAATARDLTGMRLFGLLHPGGGHEDLNLVWFAVIPGYDGAGDIARMARYSGWRNTLFSERNYRAMALLNRFIAERNGLPRNFPVLPYASVAHDTDDPVLFRRLLLADAMADQIGAKLGVDMLTARAGGAAWAALHHAHHAEWWQRFFGLDAANNRSTPCFRGFISHEINGHHPCPGPLFDWHRFAREVWDWWWYPFDFDAASTSNPKGVSTTIRAYRQARGDTPLVEYYWDAAGTAADYTARRALSVADQFTFDVSVPIYALANGVAVAARLPIGSSPAAPGFLLTRHEVFYKIKPFSTRIDYDVAPAYVWSLIRFIQAPNFTITQLSAANPDWLQRLVIRLKETELADLFHKNSAANAAMARGWAHQPGVPPSAAFPAIPAPVVQRPTTGTSIERDATAYRAVANDLIAGKAALFPLSDDPNVTPVNVLLGDYLGSAGTIAGGGLGVQVEIFSLEQLPVPGAAQRTVSAVGEDWWNSVSGPTRLELTGTELPAGGMVWQYSTTGFLKWVNDVTWASEWSKHQAGGAAHAQLPQPARPNPRVGL